MGGSTLTLIEAIGGISAIHSATTDTADATADATAALDSLQCTSTVVVTVGALKGHIGT